MAGGLGASHAVEQPQIYVGGNDGRQRKGNADLQKIGVFDGVSLLAENADARNVGGCADGGTVSAQGRARKKSEIQHRGIHPQSRGKPGDHGDHGGDVGDVINERRNENRRPNDHRIQEEHVAASHLRQEIGRGVDHALLRNAADHDEQAQQKSDGLEINFLQRGYDGGELLLSDEIRKTLLLAVPTFVPASLTILIKVSGVVANNSVSLNPFIRSSFFFGAYRLNTSWLIFTAIVIRVRKGGFRRFYPYFTT